MDSRSHSQPARVQMGVKTLDSISGGSSPWSSMSQHRKNLARGKVIDKKQFIRIRRLRGLQVGGRKGIRLRTYLQFYNQRKREGEKLL